MTTDLWFVCGTVKSETVTLSVVKTLTWILKVRLCHRFSGFKAQQEVREVRSLLVQCLEQQVQDVLPRRVPNLRVRHQLLICKNRARSGR